ncbi:hypothetical protein LINJ_34_3770 [Leishmania infantum JPCM5]|uniref:Uncharacterized protein n=2 Tax=Leishmania infantum TaxID=5671 RepID=A4IAG5_LEIIN|nr:hypothetical protein LINJ_34_3770 [Leishmania infantum JPCM5]CAC9541383.1 hypothetical_protein [Leishmania infantum]CAM71822.1 hypothetical protein LINJ_34_3770 [Leishmania infantum JPCM5]SUZ45777.1 hypothetical_protein [Leishmania infantum]|eukprot:XP_001468734.1 hypothetical protein LINJ_34_3770 [Leishmania infantum JPCM5]
MYTASKMEFPLYDAHLTISESVEEGNAIPPPDLDKPPLFLGYTTLALSLIFMGWFAYNACVCLEEETMKYHHASPILSSRWHLVLWTAISPQILFFCAYGSWVGWKFFKHN